MSSEAYHLEELEIAKRLDDARRIVPPMDEGHRRILDIGCGVGQTLIGSGYADVAMACGIDVDVSVLALGRRMSSNIQFVCAMGEALPFQSGYFDLVISRVALPYMDIPKALAESARVSRPGGTIWLVLHPPVMALRELLDSLLRMKWKGAAGRLYVLANTVAFHLLGRYVRIPFRPPRHESCQTAGGMRRALLRAGYEHVELVRDRFFVATARKADGLRAAAADVYRLHATHRG